MFDFLIRHGRKGAAEKNRGVYSLCKPFLITFADFGLPGEKSTVCVSSLYFFFCCLLGITPKRCVLARQSKSLNGHIKY